MDRKLRLFFSRINRNFYYNQESGGLSSASMRRETIAPRQEAGRTPWRRQAHSCYRLSTNLRPSSSHPTLCPPLFDQGSAMTVAHGRQFFQNPGPTNIPDRVLRAMDRPALDFMGGEFRAIAEECYAGLRQVFKTDGAIIVYAGNGHGAWEAAIVNVFSPGDRVLVPETGYFSLNWGKHAKELGLEVETLPGDWRAGVDPAAVEARLREDKAHTIKAVMQVHNETATGVANRIAEIRKAIDAARHPALYMVDTISSLGSIDFRMDEWKIDIAVGGSQKGPMLPPGMAFTAASAKALKASESAKLPRVYWDWRKLVTG